MIAFHVRADEIVSAGFLCRFHIDSADRYVLWYSNDHDGLVRAGGGIAQFSSAEEAGVYADGHGLQLQAGEPTVYDWDSIERWCEAPEASAIVPEVFLNAWNMLNDLRPTGGGRRLFAHADHRNHVIYDKLFRACNLPAITLDDNRYEPRWTRADVRRIAQVLRLGLAELRTQMRTPESGGRR
jgi:hypothetical protein